MSTTAALVGPALTTVYAVSKRSLDTTGILGAWLVGSTTGAASHRLALHLYTFFFSSSRITRVGEHIKAQIEGEFKEGGYRTMVQVLSNGGVGAAIALLYLASMTHRARGERSMRLVALQPPPAHAHAPSIAAAEAQHRAVMKQRHLVKLQAAHLCAYAAMNGDTWASELGVLSTSLPRLITTLAKVPRGTNGGVSLAGLVRPLPEGRSLEWCRTFTM